MRAISLWRGGAYPLHRVSTCHLPLLVRGVCIFSGRDGSLVLRRSAYYQDTLVGEESTIWASLKVRLIHWKKD